MPVFVFSIKSVSMVLVLLGAVCLTATAQPETPKPLAVCSEVRAETPRIVGASDNELQFLLLATPGALNSFSLTPIRNLWTISSGGEVLDAFMLNREEIAVLVENAEGHVLRTISAASGLPRSSHAYRRAETYSAKLVSERTLLRSGPGGLSMSDPRNPGSDLWNAPLPGISKLAGIVTDGRLIAVPFDDRIEIVEFGTGRRAGSFPASVAERVIAFDGEDSAVVSVRVSRIASVDLLARVRWTYRTGGRIVGGAIAGNSVVVASADNFVYRIDKRTGALVWKARLEDRALSAPIVSGSHVLVINSLRNALEIRELATGRLANSFKIPGDQGVTGVFPLRNSRFLVTSSAAVYEVAENCAQ